MNENEDKRIESDVRALFGDLSRVTFQPDPYLATKVLARIQEKKARPQVAVFWKWLGIGSTALATAMLAFFVFGNQRAVRNRAYVGQAFVVKLEVLDLAESKIARAEIQLPDGVYFDIDQFPELKQRRSLSLAWSNRDQKEFIPVVLNSTEAGERTMIVNFYDADNRMVGQKRLAIQLKASRKG